MYFNFDILWWETLCKLCPKSGYYPEASKSWLIVKPRSMTKATDIKITKSGKTHLGAVADFFFSVNELGPT